MGVVLQLIWSITLLESEEERCFSGLDCDILERVSICTYV